MFLAQIGDPPITEVVTDPSINKALVALFVAFAGVLGALFRWMRNRLNSLNMTMETANFWAKDASQSAGKASEQVTNSHKTNLRDDLDGVHSEIDGMRKDICEIKEILKSDASERVHRDRRAESQIDGLRDDVRAMSAISDREHELLHQRINDIKRGLSK